MATVSGVVREQGNLVARKVRIYRRDTGALLAETTSSAADGTFSLTVDYTADTFVVVHDDDAGTNFNAVIFDRIVPV